MPNDNSIPARTIGNGPHAVLALHGWFGHGGDWGPWEDFLDTDTFTWVFPDYRGYGRRRDHAGEFTLEEASEDLLTVLNQLTESAASVTLLGHSMGGVFAQKLLQKAPGTVSAFIGISPVPASGSPMAPEQRELFESAATEEQSRRAIIDITTGQRLSSRWLDKMSNHTKTFSTDSAVGAYFRAWADSDFLHQIGHQDIPALVIVGAMDPAVTMETASFSYSETFSDLLTLEFADAGHYAMFEQPLRLATEIETFLSNKVVEGS